MCSGSQRRQDRLWPFQALTAKFLWEEGQRGLGLRKIKIGKFGTKEQCAELLPARCSETKSFFVPGWLWGHI